MHDVAKALVPGKAAGSARQDLVNDRPPDFFEMRQCRGHIVAGLNTRFGECAGEKYGVFEC